MRGKLNEVCEVIGVYWKFGICAEISMERIIEDAFMRNCQELKRKHGELVLKQLSKDIDAR